MAGAVISVKFFNARCTLSSPVLSLVEATADPTICPLAVALAGVIAIWPLFTTSSQRERSSSSHDPSPRGQQQAVNG